MRRFRTYSKIIIKRIYGNWEKLILTRVFVEKEETILLITRQNKVEMIATCVCRRTRNEEERRGGDKKRTEKEKIKWKDTYIRISSKNIDRFGCNIKGRGGGGEVKWANSREDSSWKVTLLLIARLLLLFPPIQFWKGWRVIIIIIIIFKGVNLNNRFWKKEGEEEWLIFTRSSYIRGIISLVSREKENDFSFLPSFLPRRRDGGGEGK